MSVPDPGAITPDVPVEKIIRVGSRKSELALIQTKYVIGRLQKLYPHKKFEIHTMSTIGDRVLNISLPKIGEKSLFTRDLENALRNGGVDFVVHSLKDLPTVLPLGMAVGAVLEREDARDALVLRENLKGHTIATLPKGSVIGTSSLRRTAQLRRQYPHLIVCDIRGNLNTRLAKLDSPESKFSGIILAQAGLVRMGWMNRISQILEPTDLLYAVGQGALAVECRANDSEILVMLQKLMCLSTMCRILAERSFLKTLGGGCSAPVAVWSYLNGKLNAHANNNEQMVNLSLTGAVWSLDGAIEIRDKLACTLKEQTLKRAATDHDNNMLPVKRVRNDGNENSNSSSSSGSSGNSNNSSPSRQHNSPLVINDDADVEQYKASYNVEQLIEKHMNLVRKCPVIGAIAAVEATNAQSKGNSNNFNNNNNNNTGGGGDADISKNGDALIENVHCPVKIVVGQDVMGECPIVDNETKVNYKAYSKCPITAATAINAAGGDKADNAQQPSTSAKCPFAALHKRKDMEFNKTISDDNTSGNNNNNNSSGSSGSSGNSGITRKCPFLQKTVKMFDYADEEQPVPQKLCTLIEDVDNLFCGLYRHACYNRDFYERSNKLGQQLAEQLIKKGALDVMKSAQAEIHSKVN